MIGNLHRRWLVLGITLLLGFRVWNRRVSAATTQPTVYATVTCTPASKPGRIRCRALVELPLDSVAKQRITWGELIVLRADPTVIPLRGRLGPLDADPREDGRIGWTFSVAASEPGTRTVGVLIRVTLESRDETTIPTPVERKLDVEVKVAPS